MKTFTSIHKIIRICSTLTAVCLFLTLPTRAQSQNQDLQQMKDKLQKLEQEIEELKGQLNKAQQTPATVTTEATGTVRAAEEAQETPAEAKPEQKRNTVDLYG